MCANSLEDCAEYNAALRPATRSVVGFPVRGAAARRGATVREGWRVLLALGDAEGQKPSLTFSVRA